MKANLSWVKQFIKMGARERNKVKDLVLSQVKDENRKLYDFVTTNNMDFLGVIGNTQYYRCDGPNSELNAIWVHPHGGPALLYGFKGCLIIVSPLLRVNDSVINEIPENSKKVSLRGISG